jgi:hypothetical protein
MNSIGRLYSAFVLAALLAGIAVAQDAAPKDAASQDVYIDYDRAASLSRFKTFAIAEPQADESLAQRSPTAHRHLLGAIRKRLLAAGRLTENTASPDVYVTYRVSSKEDTSLSTTAYSTGPGWRGGYYWAGDGWGMSKETVDTYTAGTLVIDAWDAKEKRAVWRGVATDTVPADLQKVDKKVDTALDRLMKKWEAMRAEGK